MSDEDKHETDGMVALLPTSSEWCKIELPHMTVVYLGEVADLAPDAFNVIAKRASSVAQVTSPILAKVMGTEILGDDEKVNTLKLEPNPKITAVRDFFDEWDASEWDFHPHCTIGPSDGLDPSPIPMYLMFDRLMVAWGDESVTFNLQRI